MLMASQPAGQAAGGSGVRKRVGVGVGGNSWRRRAGSKRRRGRHGRTLVRHGDQQALPGEDAVGVLQSVRQDNVGNRDPIARCDQTKRFSRANNVHLAGLPRRRGHNETQPWPHLAGAAQVVGVEQRTGLYAIACRNAVKGFARSHHVDRLGRRRLLSAGGHRYGQQNDDQQDCQNTRYSPLALS